MFRIAILSLLHDRSKFWSAVAGVAFAATLTLVQNGLYEGFLYTTSFMISRMGGDVWVMAKGTEVFDSVEPLSAGVGQFVKSNAMVERVRPLIFTFANMRKPNKTRYTVQIVGLDFTGTPMVPWEMARGLPSDLMQPMSIGIDAMDFDKLSVKGEPMGTVMGISGHSVKIAAITTGVRSFTLMPFIFTNVADARRLTGLADGQANYWVLDVKDKQSVPEVIAAVQKHPELQAMTTPDFIRMTQDYWIGCSGVGGVLVFTALLGMLVGGVVVSQTLYSMIKDYRRELATLKAVGASSGEIISFVAWQAGLLTSLGALLCVINAVLLSRVGATSGLMMVFSFKVVMVSILVIVIMCAVSSMLSVRKVLVLDAAEVFK